MTISWHDHVQCHSYVLPSWVSPFPPLWSQYSGKPFACLPQAHPSLQLLIGISHPNISLFIVHIHTQHQTEHSSQLYNNVWCKTHVFRCLKVLLELGLFQPRLVRWKQKISLFGSSWFCLWRIFIQQPGHSTATASQPVHN